ncbi:NAD-dependent epimerase/dehydratase family protein [Ramlibacter sp.]|uniref:NAD-dependent epimerase/dehydratase family protein n=1 Tax=Ramlibacter sp. TaxID=1917967 RepID=UPI002D555BE0|nr:NAD-dependent epimerase/dehydratase family protein [Ramlibacter sp.]HYD74448.1 NAD-dependent epimerase/dehydratase family protein [Ramlibacter sp.]
MDSNRLVLVTGANGHLGRNLVPALVQRGYRVRATVRDTADPARTAGLAMPGVELQSLDVSDERRFSEVATGVDLLFHLAATYKNYTSSAAEADEMVRDSIEGARAAVNAAASKGVRRLVLTSSVVTLPLMPKGGRATTEDDWRTDFRLPYHRAKTLAEQEAWRIARTRGVDMVAVLPGALLGPGFTRSTSSTDAVEAMLLGAFKAGVPDQNFPAADVRDVVRGHVLAAESEAQGRFILCNDVLPSFSEMIRLLRQIDPSVPAPGPLIPRFALPLVPLFDWINHRMLGTPRMVNRDFAAAVGGMHWTMSNERARRELGWRQEVPLEQSLADTVAALRQLRASAHRGPVPATA